MYAEAYKYAEYDRAAAACGNLDLGGPSPIVTGTLWGGENAPE